MQLAHHVQCRKCVYNSLLWHAQHSYHTHPQVIHVGAPDTQLLTEEGLQVLQQPAAVHRQLRYSNPIFAQQGCGAQLSHCNAWQAWLVIM